MWSCCRCSELCCKRRRKGQDIRSHPQRALVAAGALRAQAHSDRRPLFLFSFLARFLCNSVCRSVFMRMDAGALSNANDGDARRPSAFLSERQLLLCSCSLFIVCVFPSLFPLSPPGPFPPSAPQSSGIFRVFTLQLLIVNNNTSHAAAPRARWSCIASRRASLCGILIC